MLFKVTVSSCPGEVALGAHYRRSGGGGTTEGQTIKGEWLLGVTVRS